MIDKNRSNSYSPKGNALFYLLVCHCCCSILMQMLQLDEGFLGMVNEPRKINSILYFNNFLTFITNLELLYYYQVHV